MRRSFDKIVDELVKLGVAPGLVIRAGRRKRVLFERAYGYDSLGAKRRRVVPGQVYDLASLTKVVAATSAIGILVEEGVVALDDKLSTYLPKLRTGRKRAITIRQALAHSAGFSAHCPFYRQSSGGNADGAAKAAAAPLVCAPGEKTLYSDIGFILLGKLVEEVSGRALDSFVRQELFAPLEMACTFNPLKNGLTRQEVAPTEKCKWRRKLIRAEVHDENAWAMGGVSGHAGLFGSARDLGIFACEVMRAARDGKGRVFGSSYREFLKHHPSSTLGTRSLGWDTNVSGTGTGGSYLSPGAVGMTGFTGTSLWIDLKREVYVVILSNRIHPRRENQAFLAARPLLHDLLLKELL